MAVETWILCAAMHVQLIPLQPSPFVKYQAQPGGNYCWPLRYEIHMTLWASGDAQTNNRRRFTTAELRYQSIAARWCVDDQAMAHSSRPVAHPSRTS